MTKGQARSPRSTARRYPIVRPGLGVVPLTVEDIVQAPHADAERAHRTSAVPTRETRQIGMEAHVAHVLLSSGGGLRKVTVWPT